MEFLQAITVLYNNYLRKGDLRYMLSPACFLPLMKQHPYFVYSLEKYFGYYQTHCKRMISLFLHVTNLFVLCMMNYDHSPHIYNYLQASIGLSAFHIRIFYLTMRISPLYVKKISYAYDDFVYTNNLQTAHQDFSTSYENLLAYYNDFPGRYARIC